MYIMLHKEMNMEIVYRILIWGIIGTGCLLLMLIFAPFIIVLYPLGSWIILPLIYGGLLFYNWKRKIKKDTLSEPAGFSRKQSALIWSGIVLIIFSALKLISFCVGKSCYFLGINVKYYFIPLFLIPAAAIYFRPFKKHEKGNSFGITGIIAGALLFFISMIHEVTDYAFTGNKLPIGYDMPSFMQERLFPAGAYNFEIKGGSGFLTNYAEWSCNVSKEDFEKFRKKHGYNFVLNRTDVNEDKNFGPLHYSDYGWPKPYYFYNNRHANGGGLTMRYSVPEQKLYGNYANR